MKIYSYKRKIEARQLRMIPETYYIWVAGSCDYAHEERYSRGVYIMIMDERL